MKFVIWILIAMAVGVEPQAFATLGERHSEAGAQVREFKTPTAAFRRYEEKRFTVTIHEFAALGQNVFAVAWRGRAHPDLAKLLGSHLKDFKAALAEARRGRRGHSPIQIESHGLHIEMGGTSRSVYGRVWLSQGLPAGIDSNDIR